MQNIHNLFPGIRANVGPVRPIYIYIKWILNSESIHSIWASLINFKMLRVTFSKLYTSLYASDYIPLGLYLYELMHILRHS